MKDKQYNETKRKIKRAVEEWLTPLGLRWWEVNIDYYDDSGSFPDKAVDGYHVAGRCDVNWPYRSCNIAFNVPVMVDYTSDEIEQVVIHELMHVIVNEMRDDTSKSIKHEERVCESLALAFKSVKETYAKRKAKKSN